MDPLLLSALLSAAPGLLSSLFGDPRQKLLKQQQKVIASQPQLANKLYGSFLASPAFSAGQGAIATGANATAGNLAASLGARGIGTSGTGAVLSSLTPSIVGSQMAQLHQAGYQQAQGQAQTQIQQQLAALQGLQGPSQTQQLFAGGLDAFGPYLQSYLQKRYPQSFGPVLSGTGSGPNRG